MDSPLTANRVVARSMKVPACRAAVTPNPTPMTSQMTAAPSVSDTVTGSRDQMSVLTGSEL